MLTQRTPHTLQVLTGLLPGHPTTYLTNFLCGDDRSALHPTLPTYKLTHILAYFLTYITTYVPTCLHACYNLLADAASSTPTHLLTYMTAYLQTYLPTTG